MVKIYKLFQCAYDRGIVLDGSAKSLEKTLDLLEQFSKYSVLKTNFDKTKAKLEAKLCNLYAIAINYHISKNYFYKKHFTFEIGGQ